MHRVTYNENNFIKIHHKLDFKWFDTAQSGCQKMTTIYNFVEKSSFYATRSYDNCQNIAVKLNNSPVNFKS